MKVFCSLLAIVINGCFAETLVELARNLGTTTLLGFAQQAGLAKDLANNGPFTIFAPTNAAFASLPATVVDELGNNTDLLRKVLMFHILDGRKYSSQLTNDRLLQSLEQTLNVRINVYGNTMTADGAKVTLVDNNATNGVIHVIDRVMFPLPVSALPETIAVNNDLSLLLFLVEQAQLLGFLHGDGPFTLFAPTTSALNALPVGTISDLLSNPKALVAVLQYHLVPVTAYSTGLTSGPLQTLQGGDVNITVSGTGVMVNDANVIQADIPATNGVIHVIDKALLPQ